MSHRCWAVLIVLVLAAFAAPAQAQQAAAYTNPLESSSDTANWYLYDYYNYWAVDGSPIAGHNGDASLNNNDGNSIDNAYNNYMYMESTPINISGLDTPILSWWCLNDTPDPNNNYYDGYLNLYDGNWNWGFGWSMGPSGYGELVCDTDWHQHTQLIPSQIASIGTLIFSPYIYYENYSGGGGFQGWFIDEIQILVADVTPPDPVIDLACSNATLTGMQVSWTSPYDDDVSGVLSSFDLRYSTSPINAGNFSSATPLSNEPVPDVEGTPYTMQISNLTEATTYYFAIQSTDIAGNVSPVSNIASLATLTPPPPPPPPAASSGAVGDPKDPRANDVLPCAAGTSAIPTGVFALAGLLALAFAVRRK